MTKPILLFLFHLIMVSGSYSQQIKVNTENKSGCVKLNQKLNRFGLNAEYKNDHFLMIIDTYTMFSQLPEEWVVDKWKFKKTPYIHTTRDYNNKRKKVRLRLMDSILISSTFSASEFYIKPNRTFNKLGIGLLGMDFLNDLNWKFDFKNNDLYFDSMPYDISNIAIKNEFINNLEFPWLTVQIGKIKHKLIVDLGAENDITIPAESELGKWLIKNYRLTAKLVESGGANKLNVKDNEYRIKLNSILLQGVEVNNVNIKISRNTKVSYIGCGLLKRGKLYLNFINNEIDNGQIGFELDKNEKQ
jgi:hypothetical protein